MADENVNIRKIVQIFHSGQVIPLIRTRALIDWNTLPAANQPVAVLNNFEMDISHKFGERSLRVMIALNGENRFFKKFINIFENLELDIPTGYDKINWRIERLVKTEIIIISDN